MNIAGTIAGIALLLAGPSAAAPEATDSAAAGASVKGADSEVVAVVNGAPVYFEDIERRLGDMHSGADGGSRGAMDIDRLLYQLVNDALLAQEGRALGLHLEEGVPEKVARLRVRLAVRRLEREEITDRAEVSEDEMREAYDDEYRTVTLRMITARERAEAEEVAGMLREEGADFDALAREHSVDRYAARGGLIEKIAKIDLGSSVAETVFGMEPGELTGPVETALGWALIRLESAAPADPEKYESLKPRLQEMVRFRKLDARRTEFDRNLERILPAEIDAEAVDAIDCEARSNGRLMPVVADPEAVLVKVGDRKILAGDLEKALRTRWKSVRNRGAALAAKPIVLKSLIREERLIAEALRRGYGDTEPVRRAQRAYETRLVIPRFLSDVVGAGIEVTDEEIAARYEEWKARFPKPPRLHLGQITVAEREEAERLAGLLKQGADLAWLARQHSIDRFKESGGDRGWMVPTPGLDPFQDALYESRAGDVLGPMGAEGNFSVFRVSTREEQGYHPLETVRDSIRSAIYLAKFETALDDVIQTLRDRSEIEINEEVVASLRITGAQVEDTDGGPNAPPPGHGNH